MMIDSGGSSPCRPPPRHSGILQSRKNPTIQQMPRKLNQNAPNAASPSPCVSGALHTFRSYLNVARVRAKNATNTPPRTASSLVTAPIPCPRARVAYTAFDR